MGSCDFRSRVLRMGPSNQVPVKPRNLEAVVFEYVQDRTELTIFLASVFAMFLLVFESYRETP